jgi:signal transduction histidine kinase
MAMAALPYVLLYLVLAVGAGLVAIYAWRRRYYRSGRPFTVLMGALALWCGFRVLSITEPAFEGKVFWGLLQVGGIVLIMPAWLMVSLSYSGQRWRLRPALIGALFLPPAVFFVLALTNSLHMLWWAQVEPEIGERAAMWLRVEWGPAFWAHTVYAYACFGVSVCFLVHAALRALPVERRQAWLMLGASLVPLAGNLAFLAGAHPPWEDDPTPILLFLGALISLYATVHFRVVDLGPLVEREVVLALPDGMIVLDNQQMVVQINDEAARLLGVAAAASVGRPLAALLVGSPLGAALRPVLSDLTSPHTHNVNYDGQRGLDTIEMRSRPLLAANGAVSGALLLLRDLSEKTRAEHAQAQHLAALSLINRVARATNTAPDTEGLVRAAAETIAAAGLWKRVGVSLLSADGFRLNVVADIANEDSAESLEGLSIDSPAGTALVAILRAGHSCMVDVDDPAVAVTPLGEGIARLGLRRLLVIPLYHQGAPLGLLALGNHEVGSTSPALPRVAETIGELITDAVVRARLFDEARQAERLKASFLSTVSHELRTPLTSIIGYIDMMARGIYGDLPKGMEEALGYMRLASNTLLRMINDILDFSRSEAGHLQVDLASIHLLQVVTNVVGQLRPQIVERGLTLELDVPLDLPPTLGNQSRLEQVLTNLLGNAVKFTDRGRVAVRASCHGNRLCLTVEDTGIGIAPEHMRLIFEEFRRVETSGRRVGGTGLGLAITRRLVELMGGTISVKSTPGKGSAFTVELLVSEQIEPERDQAGGAMMPERAPSGAAC